MRCTDLNINLSESSKYRTDSKLYLPGPNDAANDAPPTTWAVSGSRVISGFVLLPCPSFVISTAIRGFLVPSGNVYLWMAVRRVEVSSTRM